MGTVGVKIIKVVYPGKGLARLDDGMVVFVRDVLPGEVVQAQITRQGKNYAEALPAAIVKPSPCRMEPVCPLASQCAGCCYQHAEYGEELRLKHQQLLDFLKPLAKENTPTVLPPLPSPRVLKYRNKLELHAAEHPYPVLGYIAHDNRTVLDIPLCPLARDEINGLLAQLRADRGFMERLKPHQRITLRWTPDDGALWWVGRRPAVGGWLTERSGLGKLHVPRGSFFQVNPEMQVALEECIRNRLEAIQPAAVVDAYCGVGVFGLLARLTGITRVIGIDADVEAIRAAAANAARAGLDDVQFLAGHAADGLRRTLRDLDMSSTLVIVDPPRAGMEKAVRAILAAARPAHVLYIACAPDTMVRDVKELAAAGYRVLSSQLVDMFPRTPYFESVTWLASE